MLASLRLDTFIQYACFLIGLQIEMIGIISLMAYNRRYSQWGTLGKWLYHVVYWWYLPIQLAMGSGGPGRKSHHSGPRRLFRTISDYDRGDTAALIGGLSICVMGLFVIAMGMLYL
jgi:hypothetical protein